MSRSTIWEEWGHDQAVVDAEAMVGTASITQANTERNRLFIAISPHSKFTW